MGPWYNANRVLIANTLSELHARTGDAELFVNEHGLRINGQWPGSPSPVEHDILTGSNADGRLMSGLTCSDWTSDSASVAAQVGHSDGLGPNQSTAGTLPSWNSAHANQNCADTAPRGRRRTLLLLRALAAESHSRTVQVVVDTPDCQR